MRRDRGPRQSRWRRGHRRGSKAPSASTAANRRPATGDLSELQQCGDDRRGRGASRSCPYGVHRPATRPAPRPPRPPDPDPRALARRGRPIRPRPARPARTPGRGSPRGPAARTRRSTTRPGTGPRDPGCRGPRPGPRSRPLVLPRRTHSDGVASTPESTPGGPRARGLCRSHQRWEHPHQSPTEELAEALRGGGADLIRRVFQRGDQPLRRVRGEPMADHAESGARSPGEPRRRGHRPSARSTPRWRPGR